MPLLNNTKLCVEYNLYNQLDYLTEKVPILISLRVSTDVLFQERSEPVGFGSLLMLKVQKKKYNEI